MGKHKQKQKIPAWLHGPLYLGIRSALSALLIGEVGNNIRGAKRLGRAFAEARFNRRRLQRAVSNLAVAFPGWPAEQHHEYAIRAYEHLFMLIVETAYTSRLLTNDSWGDHLRLGNLGQGVRHLLAGFTDQRPCVLITGHCGNWELLGYAMALLGFPMHALYRPLDVKPLDRWVAQTRQVRGMYLMDKFGAMREIPRVMAKGEPVGFVADQNGGDRGLFVPFFNRLASSYKSIGLMAQRFEAPVLCGQARRLVWTRDDDEASGENYQSQEGALGFAHWTGEPFKYRVDVIDVILPEDWKAHRDPLFYITARYRRAIETMVRRAPEQYLWMHRYWKSRPRHERLGRPIPRSLVDKIRALPWMTDGDVAQVVEWTQRDAREISSGGEEKRRR